MWIFKVLPMTKKYSLKVKMFIIHCSLYTFLYSLLVMQRYIHSTNKWRNIVKTDTDRLLLSSFQSSKHFWCIRRVPKWKRSMFLCGWSFPVFTSWLRLTVNPFNPNTLQTNTRTTLSLSFFTPLLPFLYCMSNLATEPISQRVGVRGRLLPLVYRFISAPPAYGEKEQNEAGDWERMDRGVTHVESVIYFFIIKIRQRRGERTARLIWWLRHKECAFSLCF